MRICPCFDNRQHCKSLSYFRSVPQTDFCSFSCVTWILTRCFKLICSVVVCFLFRCAFVASYEKFAYLPTYLYRPTCVYINCTVKAKFHYAIWSQTGSKLVADLQLVPHDRQNFCSLQVCDQLRTYLRPDSVMEFGFKSAKCRVNVDTG